MTLDVAGRLRRFRERVDQRVRDYDAHHRRRFPLRKLSGIRRSNDPRLSTVLKAASDLGTTVGDLLEEPPLGESDLEKVREFVDFLIARFDLTGARAAASRGGQMAHVPETEFIERDFDYPRAHHVWMVPNAVATGGSGIEADRDTKMTEVLHSIRDVYNGQLRVIRVIGDSMAPVLRDGDKVTFDTRLVTPKNGDVVAVYESIRGGMIGYWRSDANGDFWLDKENDSHPSERVDGHGRSTVWGTVTRIVDTPVRPRRRRRT